MLTWLVRTLGCGDMRCAACRFSTPILGVMFVLAFVVFITFVVLLMFAASVSS